MAPYVKTKDITVPDNFQQPQWNVGGIQHTGLSEFVNFDKASAYVDPLLLEAQQMGGSRLAMSMIVPGGVYEFGSGTVLAPGIRWAADTNSGFYLIGGDNVGASIGGDLVFDWNATRLRLDAGFSLQIADLTPGRVAFVGASEELADDAEFTYNSTTNFLTVDGLNLVDTSNQLVFQSAGVTGTITWTPATSGKTITLQNLTGVGALQSAATLTDTQVLFSGSTGLIMQDAGFTYNSGTDLLSVANLTVSTNLINSALTATRVIFAGTAGLLTNDAGFTFDGVTLTLSDSNAATTPLSIFNQASTGDSAIRWSLATTISYAMGIDNSVAGDPFVLSTAASGTAVLGTGNILSITSAGALSVTSILISGLTSGRVTFAGASGVLTDDAGFTFDGVTLTLSDSNAATTPLAIFNQASTGDSAIRFSIATTNSYALGIDNSASDAFVISTAASGTAVLGTGNVLSISTAGVHTLSALVATTSITDNGLTAGRVTFAGASGLLSDDADLTFSTATLTATNIIVTTGLTNSALTAGRVVIASTAGLLADDAGLTYDASADLLSILGAGATAGIKLLYDASNHTAAHVASDGNITFTMTGTAPASSFTATIDGEFSHSVVNTNAGASAGAVILMGTPSTGGDAYFSLRITGGDRWAVGIDNSDSDSLKFVAGADPSIAAPALKLDLLNNVYVPALSATGVMYVGANGLLSTDSAGFNYTAASDSVFINGFLDVGDVALSTAQGDFSAGIDLSGSIFFDQSIPAFYLRNSTGDIVNQLSGVAATATVWNEQGVDIDFRIEGDNDPNLLFCDASTDRVGIGTSTPNQKFEVSTTGETRMRLNAAAANHAIIEIASAGTVNWYLYRNGGGTNLNLDSSSGGGILEITVGGVVVWNQPGSDRDFRVESDDESYCFMVEGTLNNIVLCANAEPGFNSMDGGVFLDNANVVPTGNATTGGYLYAEAGALKWRGSGGTTTTIANA